MDNLPPPPPLPFGDPNRVRQENKSAVGKGLLFGCGGCALLLALIAAFSVGILFIVLSSIKHSDAYQLALAKVQASPQVQQALGQPMEAGWFFTGSIHVNTDSSGSTGNANFSIPISGPKGSGTIYAVATKQNGEWIFSTLTVSIEGSPLKIDLLNPSPITLQTRQQLFMHAVKAAIAEDDNHIAALRPRMQAVDDRFGAGLVVALAA